ncbi:SPX domain-containing protein 2 [Balamuthia mandrillaris]
MKFGKHLRKEARSFPAAMEQKLVEYKRLKQLIKWIVKQKEEGKLTKIDPSVEEKEGPMVFEQERDFFELLDKELSKINSFFLKRQESYVARMQSLSRQVCGLTSSGQENKEAVRAVQEALEEFRHDVLLLSKYAYLNVVGIRKILKKYDKKTRMKRKSYYLPTKVMTQPFYKSEILDGLTTQLDVLRMQLPLPTPSLASTTTSAAAGLLSEVATGKISPENMQDVQKLYMLVALNDIEGTKKFLQQERAVPIDINVIGWDMTCLHKASIAGYSECLQALLEYSPKGGAPLNVNVTDLKDRTCLHYAAQEGHLRCVELLLEHGADPNSPVASDRYSQTPLHRASLNGHLQVVEALLAKGAHPNAQDVDGSTPLHFAAMQGHTSCIAALTAASRSNVSQEDDQGKTPLHFSVAGGHMEATRILLEKDATLLTRQDEKGRLPLHDAAIAGHKDCILVLLEKEEEEGKRMTTTSFTTTLRQSDFYGKTALHFTAQHNRVAATEVILQHAFGTTKLPEERERNGLMFLDINAQDKDLNTPLHLAAAKGNLEVIRLLVMKWGEYSNGDGKGVASLTTLNGMGLTPHDLAVFNGYLEIAAFLEGVQKERSSASSSTSASSSSSASTSSPSNSKSIPSTSSTFPSSPATKKLPVAEQPQPKASTTITATSPSSSSPPASSFMPVMLTMINSPSASSSSSSSSTSQQQAINPPVTLDAMPLEDLNLLEERLRQHLLAVQQQKHERLQQKHHGKAH